MRFLLLTGAALAALATPVGAAQDPDPRAVVQAAERAFQDDSVAPARARWSEALRRDPADRAAALGLASLARLTYDFATSERLLTGILQRGGTGPDPWTVQAKIGLYRLANAAGNTTRADSLLNLALRDARRIETGAASATR
jgi:hypothetical protein